MKYHSYDQPSNIDPPPVEPICPHCSSAFAHDRVDIYFQRIYKCGTVHFPHKDVWLRSNSCVQFTMRKEHYAFAAVLIFGSLIIAALCYAAAHFFNLPIK